MLKWLVPFTGVLVFVAFFLGFASARYHVFPYDQIIALTRPAPASAPAASVADGQGAEGRPAYPPIASDVTHSCIPASGPISTAFGNNHDVVYLPGTPGSSYAHYLHISGNGGTGQLYGAQTLSAEPDAWELLVEDYFVTKEYELDDAILIDGTHYIFENHVIYALDGDPATGSGKWDAVASFPDFVDDVAVYFDGETVHLYGEYGDYPDRPDGATIAYLTSDRTFSNWTLKHTAIADPNVYHDIVWGVGDPSLIETDAGLLMLTDLEADGVPYKIALWESRGFGRVFNFAGILAEAAPGTDTLYNFRVQDGEFVPGPDGKVFLFANWRDIDGIPGKDLPAFPDGKTRVIGGYVCTFG